MKPPPDLHYRHRFPAEIISYVVWLYHVFSPSLRDVELLLAEREIRPELRHQPAPPPATAGGHRIIS